MSSLPVVRGSIAIIWRDGRVLTGRRAPCTHLAGMREFPGGKNEAGESPEQCVVREALEETGVRIEVTGSRAVLDHRYPDRRVVLHPFDAQILEGEPQQGFTWLRVDELRDEDFPPATSPLLAELRATGSHPTA